MDNVAAISHTKRPTQYPRVWCSVLPRPFAPPARDSQTICVNLMNEYVLP
jgi:hypothetical protein